MLCIGGRPLDAHRHVARRARARVVLRVARAARRRRPRRASRIRRGPTRLPDARTVGAGRPDERRDALVEHADDDVLGTSARWVSDGSSVMLDFGGDVRLFGDDAASTTLARRSCHTFGDTWFVTETLTLTRVAGGATGSYHYAELDTGGSGDSW